MQQTPSASNSSATTSNWPSCARSLEGNRLVRTIDWRQRDLQVTPRSLLRLHLPARVPLHGELVPGLRVDLVPQSHQDRLPVPRSFHRRPEQAIGAIRDQRLHRPALDLGDEHPCADAVVGVDLHPLLLLNDGVSIAEGAGGGLEGDEGHAGLIAVPRLGLDSAEGQDGRRMFSVLGALEPTRVVLDALAQAGPCQVACELAEMADHGALVVEVGADDLDNLPAVVAQPSADQAVLLGGLRVAVDVVAEAVEVDAHALVGVVVVGAVGDVGSSGADRAIEAELPAAGAFLEAGRLEQMPQLALTLVDRVGAFVRLLRGLQRGDRVRLGEAGTPGGQALGGEVAVEMLVVVGVAEGLQAVDARGVTDRGAVLHHLAGDGGDRLEALADLVQEARGAGHGVPE